jgi:hypothetical protein
VIYRIVATIVLIAAILAVGVVLEPDSAPAHTSTPSPPSLDDAAMKSLRINN